MLRKNILPLTSMVLVLGLTGLATQVKHVKASTYGNGAVVTVPKKMQGTWYSYDRDAKDYFWCTHCKWQDYLHIR